MPLPHELVTAKVYDQVTPQLFNPSLTASFFEPFFISLAKCCYFEKGDHTQK
jgi:hypothetical protein